MLVASIIISITTICISLFAIKTYKLHLNKKIACVFDAIENNDNQFRLKTNSSNNNEDLINNSLNRIKSIVLETKHQIHENERFFEHIINQVNNGIIVLRENGTVFTINKSALNTFGISLLSHINRLNEISPDLSKSISNLKNNDSTQIKFYNESSIVQLNISASIITINSQTLKIISITDINSDIIQAEIDSWSKMSNVFTHEIMNSLAPITAISESLTKNTDPEYIKRGAEIINSTSDRLLKFVDSYRSLTRIPEPVFQETDLTDLVSSVSKTFDRKINITSSESDHTVSVDPIQLAQVITNLIKNATEVSPDNNIWINIKHNKQGLNYIEVCNDGPSIPDDIRENIFIPFFTTKIDGTGIGLSLSRQITRKNNASITLSTHPFTCFKIEFK